MSIDQNRQREARVSARHWTSKYETYAARGMANKKYLECVYLSISDDGRNCIGSSNLRGKLIILISMLWSWRFFSAWFWFSVVSDEQSHAMVKSLHPRGMWIFTFFWLCGSSFLIIEEKGNIYLARGTIYFEFIDGCCSSRSKTWSTNKILLCTWYYLY